MTDETDETESNISITDYIKEYKFLKTTTELEIDNVKKILASLPPKNYKRTSRKNITEEEKQKRVIESNRVYLSRKNNLARLQALIDEQDNYETILKNDDLKSINELLDKKKELINGINTDLEEEKATLENDLLDMDDDNKTLHAKINEYKNALKQVLTENEALKQKQYIQPQAPIQQPQFTQQQYNNAINGYTIPSAMFKTPTQNYYNNHI
jgi:hypothetical protein